MIHLTYTGYYAGHTFCGADRNENDSYQHLHASHIKNFSNPEIRSKFCPDCVSKFAESYLNEEGTCVENDAPEWVIAHFNNC